MQPAVHSAPCGDNHNINREIDTSCTFRIPERNKIACSDLRYHAFEVNPFLVRHLWLCRAERNNCVCYQRASRWFACCPDYHISFSENNQRRSRKTQLKGFGGLEEEIGLKSIIAGIRDHTYLMVASTNEGFLGSKEMSPSTFLISNAQMRFMRKL